MTTYTVEVIRPVARYENLKIELSEGIRYYEAREGGLFYYETENASGSVCLLRGDKLMISIQEEKK